MFDCVSVVCVAPGVGLPWSTWSEKNDQKLGLMLIKEDTCGEALHWIMGTSLLVWGPVERIRKSVGLSMIVDGLGQIGIKMHKWSSSYCEPVLSCLLSAGAAAVNVVQVSLAAHSWRIDRAIALTSKHLCIFSFLLLEFLPEVISPVLALEKMWMSLCGKPHVIATQETCTVF